MLKPGAAIAFVKGKISKYAQGMLLTFVWLTLIRRKVFGCDILLVCDFFQIFFNVCDMFVTSRFVKERSICLDEEELLHLLQLGGLLPRPLPLLVSNLTNNFHFHPTLYHVFNISLSIFSPFSCEPPLIFQALCFFHKTYF